MRLSDLQHLVARQSLDWRLPGLRPANCAEEGLGSSTRSSRFPVTTPFCGATRFWESVSRAVDPGCMQEVQMLAAADRQRGLLLSSECSHIVIEQHYHYLTKSYACKFFLPRASEQLWGCRSCGRRSHGPAAKCSPASHLAGLWKHGHRSLSTTNL